MFRITIVALAVLLLSACASPSTTSVVQPAQPVSVATVTVPSPSQPTEAEISVSDPLASQQTKAAPSTKVDLPTLTFEEYTEAMFRVVSRYSFVISDHVLHGVSEPITVKVYKLDAPGMLASLVAGGNFGSSALGHLDKQYTLQPNKPGFYVIPDGLAIVVRRGRYFDPAMPIDPAICVIPELLGGNPPQGYQCCTLLPGGPEFSWFIKLDSKSVCDPRLRQ
jgi:hypothetical protein